MKPFLIFMPDDMTPTDCTVCGDRCPCGLKFCALDNAKPAVEVDYHELDRKEITINGLVLTVKMKSVTLYAVENEPQKPV